MVEIHLYGKLRRYGRENRVDRPNIIEVSPRADETVASLLSVIGIPLDEIATIFINAKLLATRTKMALWLRHQQVGDNPLNWNLSEPVKMGDRIGLFGSDMSALVI